VNRDIYATLIFSKSVFCMEHMRSASEVIIVTSEWKSEIGKSHVV